MVPGAASQGMFPKARMDGERGGKEFRGIPRALKAASGPRDGLKYSQRLAAGGIETTLST